jgi:hypothetical protein
MPCEMMGRGAMRCAMSEPEQSRKYALACLRLEADCMQLAGDAPSPNSQSHFLRMAQVWSALAVSMPNANGDRKICGI